MLKSKKHPLPTLPLMSVRLVQPSVPANVPVESGKVIGRCVAPSEANNRPVQPGVSANVPVESDKVIRRRVAPSEASNRPVQPGVPNNVCVESSKVMRGQVAPSKANNRLWMSRTPKNTKHVCNHVLYTPMAKLRRNYETVLSWLQLAAIKVSQGNIR